jgi:hypothetical protein
MFASKHGRKEPPPDIAAPPMALIQCVLGGGDTLFTITSFLTPNIPEEYPLCITDIAPMMQFLAQMAAVSRSWNKFVHQNKGGFDRILYRLQKQHPTKAMDGGYRLLKWVANRIGAFPNHTREFLQILGIISASADELMQYIAVCKAGENPGHYLALPPADDLESNCDRAIALHLLGSHVIGEDYSRSPFCNEVTRRLQDNEHSAFDARVIPSTLVHQRIVGYLTLHKEAHHLGVVGQVGQVPLLSNNVFQWNKTVENALTPQGREKVLHLLLQDQSTSAREAGLVE